MRTRTAGAGRSVGFATLVVAAAATATALLLAGAARSEPTPVVITNVCANNANGALFVPQPGEVCAPSQTKFPVDNPAIQHQTCYLNSNGAIRKVASSTDCVSAPRSKKETPLTVPSLTDDLYFCANVSDGSMFFRGTSPVNCK